MNTGRKIADAELPDGWRMVRLGEAAQVDTGGTPSRDVAEYWSGEIPWMASAEVNQKRVQVTAETITEKGLESSNAKIFPPGTIMIAMNGQGSTRGKASILEIEAACNQSLAAIRSKSETTNAFLFHVLNAAYDRLRGITGEGRNGLNLELIRGYRLCLPPLHEQRAIADVLDSIDEAIERTEAVIADTETLRDSLLHELLTRGVPGWHTEWQDVPGIGTIPADWEVVRLGEIIPRFDYGTSVQCNSDPSGTPVLRIPNIASGDLDLSDLKYADLSSNEIAKLHLDAGDILLVRTNGNPGICGRSWVTGGLDGQWAFASYLVRGRPDPSRAEPAFVGLFLRSEVGRRLLRGHIRTSAGNYNLSVGELGSILFPCPPLSEQGHIVGSVASTTGLIEDLRSESGQLVSTKNAITHALLTATIRAWRNDE